MSKSSYFFPATIEFLCQNCLEIPVVLGLRGIRIKMAFFCIELSPLSSGTSFPRMRLTRSHVSIIVVTGSAPCSLGRDWLEWMKICWSEAHAQGPAKTTVYRRVLNRARAVEGRTAEAQYRSQCGIEFNEAHWLPFAFKESESLWRGD